MRTNRHSRNSSGCRGLAILTALALTASAASAETIGITSAVNLNAVGTPPQQATRVLQVGLDVFAEEKVDTGKVGQTHLIFDDGSALTIGPSSTVILDEFVYDPNAQVGKIAASVGKGLMRFVGGKISKKTPVLFKTPNSLIGIRGGIALVESNTPAEVQAARAAGRELPLSAVTLIFGIEAFMRVGDRTETMTRPGSRIVQRADGSISPAAPVSQDTLDGALALLEDRGQADVAELVDTLGAGPQALAQIAPAAGGAFGVGDDDVANTQLADLSSGNNPGSLVPPPPPGIDPVDFEDPTEIRVPDQAGSGSAIIDGTSSGISIAGLFSGRVKHAFTPELGTDDLDPDFNLSFANATVESGVFDAPTSPSLTLNIAPGDFSATSTSQPFVNDTLIGTGVLNADQDFVFYELDETSFDHKVLAWAGLPTPLSTIPTEGTTAYALRDDFVLGGVQIPFVIPDAGGLIDAGQTPMAFITWDDQSVTNPTFYGSTIVISGQGQDQISVASVFVGSVFDPTSTPTIFADFRGSASDTRENAALVGTARSAADEVFNSFYGLSGPNNFVLEAQPNTQIEAFSDSLGSVLYNPNAIATSIDVPDAGVQQSGTQLTGFYNGFSKEFDDGNFEEHLAIRGPVTIGKNITTNQVDVTIDVQGLAGGGSFPLAFGGQGRSAFIDDDRFAAIEQFTPNIYGTRGQPNTELAYIVTGDQVSFDGALPSGVTVCDCEFTTWGFAGLLAEFNDTSTETHLLPWVVGDVVNDLGQFPVAGTATYEGTVIGTTVLGSLTNQASTTHKVFGSITLNFDFGTSNVLTGGTISSYDGGTLVLTPEAASLPNFDFEIDAGASSVPGIGPVAGDGGGTFVGTGTPPANVIGGGGVSDLNTNGQSYNSQFVFFAEN